MDIYIYKYIMSSRWVTGILDETCVVCTDHRQQWRSTLCLSLRVSILASEAWLWSFSGSRGFFAGDPFPYNPDFKEKAAQRGGARGGVHATTGEANKKVKGTNHRILQHQFRTKMMSVIAKTQSLLLPPPPQLRPKLCWAVLPSFLPPPPHPGGRRLLCHLCGNGCQNAIRRALDAWWYTSRNNLCSSVASATLFDRSIENMDARWCNFLVSSAFHDRPQTTRFQA